MYNPFITAKDRILLNTIQKRVFKLEKETKSERIYNLILFTLILIILLYLIRRG